MVRLGRALLAAFADYKRARGYADMADLERCALAILRDDELSGWVQERLDARTAHLLIDEFQDTNPLQWQALHSWLEAYAGAGSDAPSVFIVRRAKVLRRSSLAINTSSPSTEARPRKSI